MAAPPPSGTSKAHLGVVGGNCRLYEREYPELEECVVVTVKSVQELGAYTELLEYQVNGHHLQGLVLLSELSRRRIRSVHKLIRVGRQEVVMVIRVDKEKGYIDLSKRRVAPEDVIKTEERYNKAKAVHSIMRHVSAVCQVPLLDLYERIGWPLYRKYGHAYDAFQVAVGDPDTIFKELELTPVERDELVKFIKQRMTPQPHKIRADIQVTCFAYEGIEAVRSALLAGQDESTPDVPIKVQLIAPPLYVMFAQCLDKAAGIEALNRAIASVKAVIESKGGALAVKMAPAVTSAQEESELSRMMADLETTGDSDEEDEDGDQEAMGDADVDGEEDLMRVQVRGSRGAAGAAGDADGDGGDEGAVFEEGAEEGDAPKSPTKTKKKKAKAAE